MQPDLKTGNDSSPFMRKLLLKTLFVYAGIKHKDIPRHLRYLIRDNYYCRLYQIKYFLKDRWFKRRYKVVEFQGEFDQELRYVLPFAYWHFLNGTLEKTISSKHTKNLYFFSNNHEERFERRIWEESYGSNYEVPNRGHSTSFSYKKWVQVPLKEQYLNSVFTYDKPILLIANKYNSEWGNPPINYISIPTLDRIINLFGDKYQIVYNRPCQAHIVGDNSDINDFGDFDWLNRNHPRVLLMNDLFERNSNIVDDFNHLQLMVYANCERFISVHGGTAAFASYFGGINTVLSKQGIEHVFGEFDTILPALSGATIHHAKDEKTLLQYLKRFY